MGLIDAAKTLFKTLQEVSDASVRIDLQAKVLDFQQQALEMSEQLDALRKENENLRDLKHLASRMEYRSNAYWLKDDTHGRPYCSVCWETKQFKVSLHDYGNGMGYCLHCKNTAEGAFPE